MENTGWSFVQTLQYIIGSFALLNRRLGFRATLASSSALGMAMPWGGAGGLGIPETAINIGIGLEGGDTWVYIQTVEVLVGDRQVA